MKANLRQLIAYGKYVSLFILIPVLYVASLSLFLPDRPVCFASSTASDFIQSSIWYLNPNRTANSSLSVVDGILTLRFIGSLSSDAFESALANISGTVLPSRPAVSVWTRSSDINVAVRIALWPERTGIEILLKTYNDRLWHQEIIELSEFANPWSSLGLVELGFTTLDTVSQAEVQFRDFAFGEIGLCGG